MDRRNKRGQRTVPLGNPLTTGTLSAPSTMSCWLLLDKKDSMTYRNGRRCWGINWLFAYCKGGNYNIHIWALFGYFICLTREFRFCLLFGEELLSCFGRANVRAFHENPNRIHTELTFINPFKVYNHKMPSTRIWVHNVCLYAYVK